PGFAQPHDPHGRGRGAPHRPPGPRGADEARMRNGTRTRESARALAAMVGDLAARGCRRLLVTSSGPGEGTSSVVSQAGRALAQVASESVLLVDADPHNPSLRYACGLQSRRGLTELIEEVYLLDPTKEDPQQF